MTEPIKVDLKRYIGKWHEIASFPAWFQKGCENTTAEYTDKGKFIEVKNSCDVNGQRKIKIGKAFKTKEPDTLKVQFFPPFKAPYKVEYIDDEYQNVVVGSGKGYLWILSRNERITDEEFNKLKTIAKNKGYDTERLIKTGKK